MMNCINWLATSYTNMQLFFNLLQYYNCTCPNLSCLDIFMIRWWWTNSQWCNLTLARRFWTTNICLWTSKILKYIYLVAQLVEHDQYFFWYSMINTSFPSRHTLPLLAHSSQNHATSCSSLMSHHRVNNKCNRVKGQHWRWLIYALHNFYYVMCFVFWEASVTVLDSFTKSTEKHLLESLFFLKIIKLYKDICSA